MTNEKKLLSSILKHLNGMNKIEAYDLTHKLETLLFYASNPIDVENLEQIISADFNPNDEIDPFHFTILPNGNFCDFAGSNDWLHIYKENKRLLPNWPLFDTYYFKTKYAPLELIKLTKKNLLENLKDTEEEPEVVDFMRMYRLTQKDLVSDKLLLLTL